MSDLDDNLPFDDDDFIDDDSELADTDGPTAEPPDLATALSLLQAGQSESFSASLYYGLSGLIHEDIAQVAPVWDGLDVEYRRTLMRHMADLSETNFDLEYRAIGLLLGLDDEDAQVRESAIGLLWADETPEYMARLIEMAQWDESALVRAAAVSALGNFILAGEMGSLPESSVYQAQDAAVSIYSNETEEIEVRRRALEAVSNSSHEIVAEAIDEAYHSDDPLMRVSAVYAMGRAYDLRWKDIVLRELRSDDPEMRYEAARASGELELEEAVPYLIALTNEGDREILEAAVWSMGEIGSERALTALAALAEAAEEAGDDSLLEAVEDAIGSATMASMGLDLDFDDE